MAAKKGNKVRSFEEAAIWASKLQLTSYRHWARWIKENPVPDDIPRNPADCYGRRGTWKGWNIFLNTTIEAKIERIRYAIVSIAFVNTSDSPGNVYTIMSSSLGEDHLKEHAKQSNFRIAKIYNIKAELKHKFLEHVDKLRSGYFGEAEKIILYNPIATFLYLDELAEDINSR